MVPCAQEEFVLCSHSHTVWRAGFVKVGIPREDVIREMFESTFACSFSLNEYQPQGPGSNIANT